MATEITRLKHLANSTRDSFMIDPRIIKIEEGHNPRDLSLELNREEQERLEASIRENGTLVPILVRYDRQQAILVDGERRLRANLKLIADGVPIESIPAVQVTCKDESERLLLALLANDGKRLHPWEDGTAYRRLEKFGWSLATIAKRTSRTERYIREAMELADSPMAVKRMLEADVVTPAIALATVRKEGSNAGPVLEKKLATAKEHGKAKVTRVAADAPAKISQLAARNLADALRTIIRESPTSRAASTARTALEGAGLEAFDRAPVAKVGPGVTFAGLSTLATR